jgi:hypothetical protein
MGSKQKNSFLSTGDLNLKKIEHMLDSMGIRRTDDQLQFHQAMIDGLLPWVYGGEWSSQAARVMKQRGLKTIEPLILTFAKRRIVESKNTHTCKTQQQNASHSPLVGVQGKTWSIAMLSIVILLVIRNFEETVFSTVEHRQHSS